MTDALNTAASEPSPWKPWHKKVLIGCGVGFAALILLATCAPDPEKDEGKAASTPETVTPETPEAAPVREKAPLVSSMIPSMAEDQTGLKLDLVDIGEHLVDTVDHRRMVLDENNWRIAAYCPESVDGRLTVGVIKAEELGAIGRAGLGAGISENRYAFTLDCP